VSSTLVGRLRSWASQDSVQELTDEEEHPDGWLIEALGEVFEKDSETIESLKQSLLDQLPADEAIPTVMTVRMKLDSNTLEETGFEGTDWVYPTDVGVLKEAMKRYATANAADKNIDSGSSEGQGVGVVTGQEGRVVGTPESPLVCSR